MNYHSIQFNGNIQKNKASKEKKTILKLQSKRMDASLVRRAEAELLKEQINQPSPCEPLTCSFHSFRSVILNKSYRRENHPLVSLGTLDFCQQARRRRRKSRRRRGEEDDDDDDGTDAGLCVYFFS